MVAPSKLPTGIESLDQQLGGGIPVGAKILIDTGGYGIGESLGLQIAKGLDLKVMCDADLSTSLERHALSLGIEAKTARQTASAGALFAPADAKKSLEWFSGKDMRIIVLNLSNYPLDVQIAIQRIADGWWKTQIQAQGFTHYPAFEILRMRGCPGACGVRLLRESGRGVELEYARRVN